MRLLIIGKNGQLGQELVRMSERLAIPFVAYDRAGLDIKNSDAVRAALDRDRPDCIINTSAFHVVPACEDNPEEAFAVNTAAVEFFAHESKKRGIRFVTYSSDYVFDGKKGTPYVEEDVPHPLQVYGESKFAGEKAALAVNPDSLVIRTCGVYGGKTGSASKGGNFVLSILREAQSKKELEVSSEQIVNPTFARHLADATLTLMQKKPEGGIYHLANEGYCSWAEFAAAIVSAADVSLKIIPIDRSGTQQFGTKVLLRPLFSALQNTKAAFLGVNLPHWEFGVREYVRELKV